VDVLPNGKLVHIDRAAHMVFEDNPEDFIRVLHDFLD